MAPETVVTVDLNKQTQQQAPPPQQQQGGALDWIKINIDYFKSPPGILKVVQLVSNFKRYKPLILLTRVDYYQVGKCVTTV